MTTPPIQERYLDLLKKSLAFMLWEEPPIPLWALSDYLPVPLNAIARWGFRLSEKVGLYLGASWKSRRSEEARKNGLIWPGYAHTMIGMKRLDNLQYCVETILEEGIPGDLAETGVWRGGATIFMRGVLAAHEDGERKVFVIDSFEGLPPPDTANYPQDRGDNTHKFKFLAVSQEQVQENFSQYDLLDDRVVFIKGWFKDTLPAAPIDRLAVLRLDGDMYESTIQALESLYPKLSAGGFCIIDDYGLPECARAVQDYRQRHHISDEILEIDYFGRYWRKSVN
ncbi:MAG: TylF/MycF family methyltransferase [Methylococcaceae bacterium]|nr:TylF/MycF family methyltransferase [Methylococcaceae bacterium]